MNELVDDKNRHFFCLWIQIYEMDLIRAYQDEGTQNPKEEEETKETIEPVLKKMHVDLAPSLPVSKQVGDCIVVSV